MSEKYVGGLVGCIVILASKRELAASYCLSISFERVLTSAICELSWESSGNSCCWMVSSMLGARERFGFRLRGLSA